MQAYEQLMDYIDQHEEAYQQLARDLFQHPETSNHEYYACQRISAMMEELGFTLQREVAGHPTGFIARSQRKGKGATIGILCEYDALPNLGHACGHNIYAAVSALTAAALAQVVTTIGGEIRLFGTPCEEGGENANAKISYVNAGLFDDVDVALSLHPSYYTRVSPPTLAIDGMEVIYHGRCSHSSNAPEKGINALDAGVQFYNAMSMLRQQSPDGLRFIAYFTDGGQPGVIPDRCALKVGVAALNRSIAEDTMQKLLKIADGAAWCTGCSVEKLRRDRCDEAMITTPLLDERYMEYAKQLGAGNINEHYEGGLGATDVGNVSQVIPTLHSRLSISTTPITAHTVEFREAANSAYGLAQIAKGAKALAGVGLDLLTQPSFLAAVKEQHAERKRQHDLTGGR